MRMICRVTPHIELTKARAAELRALVRATTTPPRLVLRARIMRQATEGPLGDLVNPGGCESTITSPKKREWPAMIFGSDESV